MGINKKKIELIMLTAAIIYLGSCQSSEKTKEVKAMEPIELNKRECWKDRGYHNPLMTQKFGADPWAMVYGDTVYVYMTADEIEKKDGEITENTYSKIHKINIICSKDLVNWTECGCADIRASDVKWARNTWAPAAAWKTIDGKDKFFLYFADSANGIGVLSADSPAGPFTDPLGHALISRNTPNCNNITWLFDPAVLVDDDGKAYLYFGGGVPGGNQPTEEQKAAPGTSRAVQLGDDMISIVGEPVKIDPPYLFEDSGINKFNGKYYYSYCTNFMVPPTEKRFSNGQIAYMTSDNPLGPFEYQGMILKNPGEFFGDGGNNHHCMFTFKGKNYIAYHARLVEKRRFFLKGYRSTNIDALEVKEDGTITTMIGTKKGIPQVGSFNPFEKTNACTFAVQAGVEFTGISKATKYYGSGEMALTGTKKGDWIFVEGADFGAEGAKILTVSVKCENACDSSILVYLDSEENPAIGEFCLSKCKAGEDFAEIKTELSETVTGIHDILFVFTGNGFEWKDWSFN